MSIYLHCLIFLRQSSSVDVHLTCSARLAGQQAVGALQRQLVDVCRKRFRSFIYTSQSSKVTTAPTGHTISASAHQMVSKASRRWPCLVCRGCLRGSETLVRTPSSKSRASSAFHVMQVSSTEDTVSTGPSLFHP